MKINKSKFHSNHSLSRDVTQTRFKKKNTYILFKNIKILKVVNFIWKTTKILTL